MGNIIKSRAIFQNPSGPSLTLVAGDGISLSGTTTITITNTIPALFTDSGAFTYLTSTTDLFQVGSSSSLGASLGVKGQGSTDGTINATFNNSSGNELFKIKNGGAIELGSYLSGSGNGSIFMNANALSDTYIMNVLYSNATTNTGSNSSFALRLDVSGYPMLRTSKQRMILGANGLDSGTGTELYIDYGSHRFLFYDDATLIANIDRDNGISFTPDSGTGVIVGAGVSSLTGSAALQVNSTTQGFLLPRMTTTQKNAMSPSSTNDKGLMVFDTTLGKACVWNGTAWETVTSL